MMDNSKGYVHDGDTISLQAEIEADAPHGIQ